MACEEPSMTISLSLGFLIIVFFTADYKLSIFEVKVIELALLLFDNLVFFYELYCLSSAFLYPLLALMQNRRCS